MSFHMSMLPALLVLSFVVSVLCMYDGVLQDGALQDRMETINKVRLLKNLARALQRKESVKKEYRKPEDKNNVNNDENNVESIPDAVHLEDFNITPTTIKCPDEDPCNPPNGFCTDKMGDPYGLGYLCICFGENGGYHCQHEDACTKFPCPRQRPDCYATVEDDCSGRHCYPPKINAQIEK